MSVRWWRVRLGERTRLERAYLLFRRNPTLNTTMRTRTLLHLVGGTFFNVGTIRPFAETRFMLGNGSALSLKSGFLFAL